MALRIIKLLKLLTSAAHFGAAPRHNPQNEREFTHPSIAKLSITRVLFPWERLYMHIYQLNMLIPAAIRPPGTSPGVFMTRNCWYPLIYFSQLRHHLVFVVESQWGTMTRAFNSNLQFNIYYTLLSAWRGSLFQSGGEAVWGGRGKRGGGLQCTALISSKAHLKVS